LEKSQHISIFNSCLPRSQKDKNHPTIPTGIIQAILTIQPLLVSLTQPPAVSRKHSHKIQVCWALLADNVDTEGTMFFLADMKPQPIMQNQFLL